MTSWEKSVDVIVLFSDDIEESPTFYQDVLGLAPDRHATDFWFGETLVMLLDRAEAAEQIAPARLAPPAAGSHLLISGRVPDLTASRDELASRGVTFTGARDNRFADPSGHHWQIAARSDGRTSTEGWADIPEDIDHITVTVPDLAAARAFYEDVLGLRPGHTGHSGHTGHGTDATAASYRLGTMSITLTSHNDGSDDGTAGARVQLCTFMDTDLCDVDTAAAELAQRGVALLSGPADRAWGKRTVMFKDPANCIWELVQNVAANA